jgi:hypothetical protein
MMAAFRVVLLLIACGFASRARCEVPLADSCDTDEIVCASGYGLQGLAEIKNQSLFWAGVDAVWLSHGGGDFRSEILDPANGTIRVAQDLTSGLTVAPRIRLGSALLDTVRMEFIYFQSGDWDSTAEIAGTAAVPELNATVDYSADVRSFEWNFIGPQSVIDTQWLLGLRYLRYRDSFLERYQWQPAVGPVINEAAAGSAENEAFGPQAGIGLNIEIGRNMLSFGSKLGLLNNRIHQTGPSYNNAIVIDGVPETTFQSNVDELLWMGDIEVGLTRYVTPHFALRIGYQGMFLDQVVQASSQNGRQAAAENLWFHGLALGGELIW